MTDIDIETKQSTAFSNRQGNSDRQFGFDSFTAEVEYKQTFGAMEFFAQGHADSIFVPSDSSNGHNAHNLFLPPKAVTAQATTPSCDSSIFTFTPEIEVFRTDVQCCNSQVCLACRPRRSDHATQFLRVPKVTPENIPKLPSKWWSEQSYDSNWLDKFWTSLTKIMDGEACGPVKYCGGETTKCNKSSAVNKYERDKH